MTTKKHYLGLTDAQVLESRAKYGVNVLTPPEKKTLWNRLRDTCFHWISIAMIALTVGTGITAVILLGSMGTAIWVMPAIMLIAASSEAALRSGIFVSAIS